MTPRPPARTSVFSAGWLSAAALLVISLGLGGYSLSLRQRITGLEADLRDAVARLDRSEQQVAVATRSVASAEARMAVLTAPDLRQVNLAGQRLHRAPQVARSSAAPAGSCSRRRICRRCRPAAYISCGLSPRRRRSARVARGRRRRPRGAALRHARGSAVTGRDRGHRRTRRGVPAPTGEKYLVGATD
jgi:hypothetical protein